MWPIFLYWLTIWMIFLWLTVGYLGPLLWLCFCQFLPLVLMVVVVCILVLPDWVCIFRYLSFWCIIPFIIKECPSSSHYLFLLLFWNLFRQIQLPSHLFFSGCHCSGYCVPLFHLESRFVLAAKMCLLNAARGWVLFIILFATLCLLIGELGLLTFRVIMDIWGFPIATLSLSSGSLLCPSFLCPC